MRVQLLIFFSRNLSPHIGKLLIIYQSGINKLGVKSRLEWKMFFREHEMEINKRYFFPPTFNTSDKSSAGAVRNAE